MKKLRIFVIFFCVLVFLVICYSRYIGTTGLITKEYAIYNKKLPESYDDLKIVHFSDLHYLRIITEERMEQLVSEVNLINPDIIVFTGDLIDNDYELETEEKEYLINMLRKMNYKYGKYAVLGNHDYMWDFELYEDIYKNSDFVLLNNDYDIIYNEKNDKLFIGGLGTVSYGQEDLDLLTSYFEENDDINYKIILVHEPNYADKIIEKNPQVNLILSGHSHNGQVNIRFVKEFFLPSYSDKYFDNYYKINNTDLYVSSGIGVSAVNFRLFNKPSINFYRLRKK